ncbi:hypothetical protein BG003_010615 [Podila horticola]|nr:hypothetical protein BG003_010615 [Podila horticola]
MPSAFEKIFKVQILSDISDALKRYHATYSKTRSAPSTRAKTAVLMIGNSGAGKSTLLTQLGAKTFTSGVQFRKGHTKEVHEEEVAINGQDVLLIDVPGVYEPSEKETMHNAKKLTEALSRGYDYKLYFIMEAGARGPEDKELVMMSKINQCIKQATGSRVSFRIIVNKIMDQQIYDMYQQNLADDNCKSLFASMDMPKFPFKDIQIDRVVLLRYDKDMLERKTFGDVIAADVRQHSQYAITTGELKFSKADLTVYNAAVMALIIASPVITTGVAIVGGVLCTGWVLVRALKAAHLNVGQAFAKKN